MSTHVWTFLSNHTHVLVCITRDPQVTMRTVAAQVGITERAVQRIVAELEADGYLHRQRDGRRNTYATRRGLPLRHPLEAHVDLDELLDLLTAPAPEAGRDPGQGPAS